MCVVSSKIYFLPYVLQYCTEAFKNNIDNIIIEVCYHFRYVNETNCEKDEDTDGISIISDSDPESSFPELSFNRCHIEEVHAIEQEYYNTINSLSHNNDDNHESIRSEDDFLGDSTGKHKTYVHRRNKRLSTVLNIIVLGSVITAAGVAIGHMWGAKNDCTLQTVPSVNKILSNLYKLQEENAYLRSKLKEITLFNNMQQKKSGSEKLMSKPNKCKKVFEESLNNKNAEKYTKCVDIESQPKIFDSHIIEPDYEKEFISDINKLKHAYEENKYWLDEEVSKRLEHEKQLVKKLKNDTKGIKKMLTEKNVEKQLETISELPNIETEPEQTQNYVLQSLEEADNSNKPPVKKVSYADSLQSSDNQVKKIEKRDTIKNTESMLKGYPSYKRKAKKNFDVVSEHSLSDDEFKKDDRYIGQKHKQERKKFDRQKSHKKQKRKNKYEQWEMKGGYMKNYDVFSVTSQDSEHMLPNQDKNKEIENVDEDYSLVNDNIKSAGIDNVSEKTSEKPVKDSKKHNKQKDASWYENRVVLRIEARKKLQQELFGDSSPNTAGWYFRRMQRREQCRAKNDNSTHRKFQKRNLNYKMKH